MGFEYYSSYYKMGFFTKDNLALFVEVGMLSAEDEQKILAPVTVAQIVDQIAGYS